MNHVYKLLALLLLLMGAQQASVVHELSHVSGWSNESVRVEAGTAADTSCALCPVFAQVVTPAFSHSFHIPPLGDRRHGSTTPQPRSAFLKLKILVSRSEPPEQSAVHGHSAFVESCRCSDFPSGVQRPALPRPFLSY
jgi:hypothetical protein